MFVEEYLRDLRAQRFRPSALADYARRVWGLARSHMDANPGAVRSVWLVGLGFFGAAFVVSVALALAYDRALAYDFLLRTSLWILPAFGLVSLAIGLLRDRDGYTLSALNLPTALTLLRITLTPAIVLFLTDRHFGLALAAFVLAGLTDVADGWIARRWRQDTLLGRILDPIVDIVFQLAVFLALAAAGVLPAWAAWAAVVRYGVLLVGGACLYLFVGPVRIAPTTFGRATGVFTAVLVGLLLLWRWMGGRTAEVVTPLTEAALGVMLWATVIHVIVLGWVNLRHMRGEARAARGRVVGDVRFGPR